MHCFSRSRGSISVAFAVCFTLLSVPGCARLPSPAVSGHPNQSRAPRARIVGRQGPMGDLASMLPAASAPGFVRLGLRLTYKVHTATVKGTGRDWKPDPDGQWETPDGQRWTPGERRSNAAQGLLVFDVTALGANEAAVLAGFYLLPLSGGPPQLAFQYPIVGPASSVGGIWIHPDQLKALTNRVSPSVKIQRMPCKAAGETKQAVWIQTINSKGNSIYAYDEQTGLLLHDATSASGPESQVIGEDEVSNTPSTTLSDGTLVAQRVIERPWQGESAKEWSDAPSPLTYAGTSTVPTAAGAPLTLRQNLAVTPKERGAGWVTYGMALRTTNDLGMPPTTTPSETVSGLGQFGGAWIPPAALGRLTRGQRLDYDALTGVTVTVTEAGGRRVTITAAGRSQTIRWSYDATTGIMIALEKSDPTPLGPIQTRLTLQGRN